MTKEIQFNSEEEMSNDDSEISEEVDFQGNAWKRRYSFISITKLKFLRTKIVLLKSK